MNVIEKLDVSRLLVRTRKSGKDIEYTLSIVQRAAKLFIVSEALELLAFMHTIFPQHTSNMCERFFPVTRHTMKTGRKGVLRANLQWHLFLYMIREY